MGTIDKHFFSEPTYISTIRSVYIRTQRQYHKLFGSTSPVLMATRLFQSEKVVLTRTRRTESTPAADCTAACVDILMPTLFATRRYAFMYVDILL